MARSRNIKPGFFKSEQVADCSDGARLLFIGLWILADYRGVLEWRARKVKAELFSYDENRDMETLISELETQQLISILEQNGKRFVCIREFSKYQNPHKNECDSGSPLPNPTEFQDKSRTERHDSRAEREDSDPNPADSLILIPDSLIPDPDSLIERSLISMKPRKQRKNIYSKEFEEFWAISPKTGTKLEAFQAWQVLDPDKETRDLIEFHILEHIRWRKEWNKVDSKHCPNWKHMCRWLKYEAWTMVLDWPKMKTPPSVESHRRDERPNEGASDAEVATWLGVDEDVYAAGKQKFNNE
ncbi:hypothetical protein LCGC14_0811450 [marine sediment metagenome]|uniref:Uncharacterized protein n=1 Tax=marine sediment metagenome TaxID=412755 RepID=A0A0F9PR39_9ZZZZ